MQTSHKVYLCLLGLAFAGAAKASPSDVIPHPPHKGWEFNLEALYLEPNNQDLGVATEYGYAYIDDVETEAFTHDRVKPDSGWGYRIGATYHFRSSPNDVALNLTHLGHAGDKNVQVDSEYFSVRGDNIGGEERHLASSASFEFDAANLEYGDTQQWRQWTIRTFAGLQFVDLKHSLNLFALNPYYNEFAAEAPSSFSRLKGLGPRLGFDAVIPLAHHWSFVGSAAVELLVSYMSSHGSVKFFEYRGGEPDYNLDNFRLDFLYKIKRDSFRTVVPGFEAKMGLNYTHNFMNGLLTTEGGYRVYDYIHAIRHDFLVQDSYSIAETKVSDFGLHGVYLSVNYAV